MNVDISSEPLHPILANLKPVLIIIAETFGKDCEVVLHDLQNPKHSVVMVVNGHVTGRRVGQSFRDLISSVLRSKRFEKDRLSNYLTKTSEGKRIKSSTALIRDMESNVIGAICINYDLDKYMHAKKFIDEFCETVGGEMEEKDDNQSVLEEDVLNILHLIIQRVIDDVGIPVASMKKDDKINIVRFLDEKGVFLIKGAVDRLATELNISRYTIYNYLDEVRAKK